MFLKFYLFIAGFVQTEMALKKFICGLALCLKDCSGILFFVFGFARNEASKNKKKIERKA